MPPSANTTTVEALAQALIRIPSVTPDSGNALDWAQDFLDNLGFSCQRLPFGVPRIDNLYATWGSPDHRLLFCGHVDVVPVGNVTDWSCDPFAADITDGRLIGRGAVDMKGNIAAYFAALTNIMMQFDASSTGLAILLTGDEEGEAQFGVKAAVPHLIKANERWIGCLTGEPTSQQIVGDTYKHGRRGSLSGKLILHGVQGHTGYPDKAENPNHAMITALTALRAMPLDNGCDNFQPSWLAISSIDSGNTASNVIPAQTSALLNYRFNIRQSSTGLQEKSARCVTEALAKAAFSRTRIEWQWNIASEPFLTDESVFTRMVRQGIVQATGQKVYGSTAGGTSDSRFIHPFCPVVDLGLCSQGMHAIDESVAIDDLHQLQKIYAEILQLHAKSAVAV